MAEITIRKKGKIRGNIWHSESVGHQNKGQRSSDYNTYTDGVCLLLYFTYQVLQCTDIYLNNPEWQQDNPSPLICIQCWNVSKYISWSTVLTHKFDILNWSIFFLYYFTNTILLHFISEGNTVLFTPLLLFDRFLNMKVKVK